jgi:hypothetical protein
MEFRQMMGRPKPEPVAVVQVDSENAERCLTLLVAGMAQSTPEVDPEPYKLFRSKIEQLSRQIPDHLPNDDKMALIRAIIAEFESYRRNAEDAIRDRRAAWQILAKTLLLELLSSLGVDPHTTDPETLLNQIQFLSAGADIRAWANRLDSFVHPIDAKGNTKSVGSPLKVANRSLVNDNAAGLRGGGAAVEYLRKVMERGNGGFVVLFRLSCLDVISTRFGLDAVHDCVMSISAFLTQSLQSDDAIFHWSDSALMAVLQGRVNEQILNAELQRVISKHRESTVTIGGRAIMLRIPIAFELTPINLLQSAEDLYRLPARKAANR